MNRIGLLEEVLTESIIGAFFEVYNTLGFGFLESVYVAALQRELTLRGHRVAREVTFRVTYKDVDVAVQRLDMVVDERVVVEVKSTYELSKAAPRQVYSYLSASKLRVGLLLHFGPQARFYRMISTDLGADPPNPPNPSNPAK
jgi:GxxExxY protein